MTIKNIVQSSQVLGAPPEAGETKVFNKNEYRKEVSRLAALANKRIKRLEANDLTDSPAYQRLVKDGIVKFGVRGKTHRELQTELSNLKRFIGSDTSTIRGINTNLKNIAENTGIRYNNIKELRLKASKFFELSSKVEQYLRTVEDMASAIGYNQIWEVINVYVQENKIDLASAETNIDDLVEGVSSILSEVSSDSDIIDLNIDLGWVLLG